MMVVENNTFCKENSVPNHVTNSDDSYSGASFPWFPSQTKRKSRLGTHRKDRVRVLQDVIVSNVSAEFGPLTLNQESETRVSPVSTCAPVEAMTISPPLPTASTIEPNLNCPPLVNHFGPLQKASQSASFGAFNSIFRIPSPTNHFNPPSLSPHSTPMELFDSIYSPPSTATDFKSLSLSPHMISTHAFDPACEISFPTNDLHSSNSSSRSASIYKLSSFDADFRTPSQPSQSTSVDSGLSSDHDFKTPNLSSQLEPIKTLEAVPNVPPLIKPLEVFQQSNSSNTNLKSSLKKPVISINEEKPAIVDTHHAKPRETTPRKEVRFAEPAYPLKSSSQKLAKELPAHITVKDKTYRVWRELGVGGSCVVYEVFDPEMNDTLAIKRVSLPEEEEHAYVAEGYLQEVKMLEKLQASSDVIIKMFDHELVYENNIRVLYVVLEKGEMDLSKYMRCISKTDKLHYILFCWRQMLSAVSKIHDEEIIHLDLKPANFLLVKGRLKLIDFGIASSMPGDKTSIYLEATSGTLSYTSPETLSMTYSPVGSTGYRISKKSDVWSLGCILYRWIYGHVPFHTSLNKWQRLQDIMSPDKKVEFPERKDIPEPLLRSLQSCLEKDPKKRPTVKELLQLKLEISLDQCMN